LDLAPNAGPLAGVRHRPSSPSQRCLRLNS
jgi:hypothetical protein